MIDLVALDMAGTTIDDGGAVYVALRAAVEEAGASVAPDDLQAWMGTEKTEAVRALLSLGGAEASAATVEHAHRRFRAILEGLYRERPPGPVAGVEEALRALRARGVRIALTTGFDDDVAMPLLESLGWSVGGLLDAVVTTSHVAAGRPAPYLIHHAMERTGVVDVRRVLAAGDTLVDLAAARNAGVVAVGVATGALGRGELEAAPHDHVLESVAELPALSGLL